MTVLSLGQVIKLKIQNISKLKMLKIPAIYYRNVAISFELRAHVKSLPVRI